MKYTVKTGDTLSKIARDVLGNLARWPELARLNNIGDPYVIYVGQVLTLPDRSSDRTPEPMPKRLPEKTPGVPETAGAAMPVNVLLIGGVIVLLLFFMGRKTP